MTDVELEATVRLRRAYHESGHAVVALAVGGSVESVSLTGHRPGFGGFCSATIDNQPHSRVLLALGGNAARLVLARKMGWRWAVEARHINDSGADDLEEARTILAEHGAIEFLPKLMDVALRIVEEDWSTVEAIAQAVLPTGLLSGIEVAAVLAKVKG